MILDINSRDGETRKYLYYNFIFKTYRITLHELCFYRDYYIAFFGEKQVNNLKVKTIVKLSKLLGGELDKIY